MDVKNFMLTLKSLGAEFYTGVPDSLLSPFIDCVMARHGISNQHVVAANEGAAVGLAAGHFLATGKPAVVYMQNSGIGNAINPICSLLHQKVYALPVIFVVGWRGEPGIKDEPQHVFQGEVTLSQLEGMEIPHFIISNNTTQIELNACTEEFKKYIANGQSVAFVIRKESLHSDDKIKYVSNAELSREQILGKIIERAGSNDVFVCTTGKLSREVFEIREQKNMEHGQDFLTVGSMGHSLMIAYGVALAKSKKRVFCIDGDGAALMHLGSLGVAAASNLSNLIHIIINNGAHETVGGVPTVAAKIEFDKVASALGYKYSFRVKNEEELLNVLDNITSNTFDGLVFVEIICNLKSRKDLGRPTTTPIQNKNDLMKFLGAAK